MNATKSNELISKLNSTEFKTLFNTKPYLHVLAMIYNYLIIFGMIYLCIQFPSAWLYLLTVITVGARMHALAILMHDATHFRFLKNRKWNDFISNYFIMYPIFTSIEKYRKNHLQHHQHLNTEEDPDWVAKLTKREFQFPKTKTAFMMTTLSYLVLYQGVLDAFWFLKRFGGADKKTKVKLTDKLLKLGFYVVLFSALTFFGVWKYYLLFWVVPYFSTFFMFQYIRSVAEHFGELAYEDELSSSRTVKPSLIENFFIAPHNVGYHLEHHLYPGVPFYHLPKLHQLLMEQKEYQTRAHVTNGYVAGLLQELGSPA